MDYDVIIIGSGPAGCAASIYASRYGLSNIVIGKTQGGTISYAHNVENYPGSNGISGVDLMITVEKHVKDLGSQIIYDPVNKLEKVQDQFMVTTSSGKQFQSRAVIIATGTERKKLNIPGEQELVGKGVTYCVTCDAPFYKDKTVVLVGGGDAACSGAVHLSQFAKKIYLVYRGSSLRAEPTWVSQWQELASAGKGEEIFNTNITKIISEKDKVAGVELDKEFNGSKNLACEGVFIEIGGVPGTELIRPLGVKDDDSGHVVVNQYMETSLPGLFAAGDMTDQSKVMKQVITAMAWGAIAASSAYKYIKGSQAPQLIGVAR